MSQVDNMRSSNELKEKSEDSPSVPLFGPTESYLGEEEWLNPAPEGGGKGDDEVVAASGDPLTSGEADQGQFVAPKRSSVVQQLRESLTGTKVFFLREFSNWSRHLLRAVCLTDVFGSYNQNSAKPRGLCVIFNLFSGDLQSYKYDTERAFRFFKRKLGYTVYADHKYMLNCSQKQLLLSIDSIINDIEAEKKKNEPYDRLVFILMSHGLKVSLNIIHIDTRTEST